MEDVDKTVPGKGLPDFLRRALTTDEVGGHKLYDTVLNDAVELQRGTDRPVVRQALEIYIKQGLIGKFGGNPSYLQDLTTRHPPRLTEQQYQCLLEVRALLSTEFQRLSLLATKAKFGDSSNVYYWMGLFVKYGLLEKEAGKAGSYRLGKQLTAAVYPEGEYHTGTLITFSDTNPSAAESAVGGEYQEMNCEEASNLLVELLNSLEHQSQVREKIQSLRETLTAIHEPNRVKELLQPLTQSYSSGGDSEVTDEELGLLRASLPVWQKYLGKEDKK